MTLGLRCYALLSEFAGKNMQQVYFCFCVSQLSRVLGVFVLFPIAFSETYEND